MKWAFLLNWQIPSPSVVVGWYVPQMVKWPDRLAVWRLRYVGWQRRQFATVPVFPLTFVSAQYMLIMYPEEGGEGYPFSEVWTLL